MSYSEMKDGQVVPRMSRDDFESWAKSTTSDNYRLHRMNGNREFYRYWKTQHAWEGWQAAVAMMHGVNRPTDRRPMDGVGQSESLASAKFSVGMHVRPAKGCPVRNKSAGAVVVGFARDGVRVRLLLEGNNTVHKTVTTWHMDFWEPSKPELFRARDPLGSKLEEGHVENEVENI